MTEDGSQNQLGSVAEVEQSEIQNRNTSLLERVREGLQSDKRVFIGGEIIHSNSGMGWLETVDIIVAPIKPIYDPKKLNLFMDELVPNLTRSAKDEASHRDKTSNFELGKLYFDETLGIVKREIKITTTAIEPTALERSGVQIGESHKTEEERLKRRTWVRVYPDATSAQIVAEYEKGIAEGTIEPDSKFDYLQHWFSPEQFNKIKNAGGLAGLRLPKLTKGNL